MKSCFSFILSLCLVAACLVMADEAEYKKIIGSVGGHKSFITRLCNDVDGFVGAETLSGEQLLEAEDLLDEIKVRLGRMQGIFDELLSSPELQAGDIDTFVLYTKGVNSKLAKLKLKINQSKKPVKVEGTGVPATPPPSLLESAVKYPEITLPKFSGGVNGVQNFRPFIQIFRALVEEKEGIPKIYKVQYLRGCLPEGSEAFKLISHIPPTEENYEIMIETLMSRYHNTTGEANRLRRQLMQISSWSVCNSVESQRRLIEHVRQTTELLRQIDVVEDEESRGLALLLVGIIPERLKYKVAKWKKDERTVEAILKLVEESMEVKQEVQSFSDPAKKSEKSGPYPPRQVSQSHLYHTSNQPREQTVGTFVSTSRCCIYCGESSHAPHNCTQKSKEERAQIVSKGRRCWNCLSDEHQVRNCSLPSRCGCGKKGKHSLSLCGIMPPWKSQGPKPAAIKGRTKVASLVSTEVTGEPYLSTIVLELLDKSGTPVKVRLLLDNASTHTYGDRRTISQLKSLVETRGSVDMTVSTFSGLRKVTTQMVELELSGDTRINLLLTDSICEPLQGKPLEQESLKELDSYTLADPSCITGCSLPIDILVGVDNYWKLVRDDIVRLKSGLVIMSTLFGWVLSGESGSQKSLVHRGTFLAHALVTHGGFSGLQQYGLMSQDSWYNPLAHSMCAKESVVSETSEEQEEVEEDIEDIDLEEVKCELEKFWDLDTLGIKPEREISPVLEDFNDNIKQDPETKRFTVSLPRKRNVTSLQSNFNSSLRRLDSLSSKLKQPGKEELSSKYHKVIEDQLEQGIIERVILSDEEKEKLQKFPSKPVGQFYIPHHAVQKARSDKVRIVYDASARPHKGALSLNQCLLVGPSLMNHLAEVLLTFRLYIIVLLADIEKAFLQICVSKEDRDLLRFLWYDKEGNLEVYRFTRVPFGTGPSPFLLNATLKYHLEKIVEDQELLELLLRSLYVDDVLTGGKTPEIVLWLRAELVKILGKAAMKLHGWNSNSAEVREALGVEDEPDDLVVLGMAYNRVTDDMGLNLEKILKNTGGAISKRELLRSTAQFFDPHGLFNPVLLLPKLLFQRVCSKKVGWDDPLPEDVAKEWSQWRSQLPVLGKVRVQRRALLENYDRLELHGFSDASKVAYSACIYIRSSRGEEVESHLIMCKNRVAPKKKLTIPRLELMGALLLSRLMAVVVAFLKHLKFEKILYYCDSMNVLYWIRSEHRMWCVFVACRIKEINALSNFMDWIYVRTDLNPADIATRGLTPEELVDNKFYFEGPEFVRTGQSPSGVDVDTSHPPAACLQERKKALLAVIPVQKSDISKVIKCEDYSSLNRLYSVTAVLLRFMFKYASKYLPGAGDKFEFSTAQLYGQARQLWTKAVQAEYYSEEIRFLRNHPGTIPNGLKLPSSLFKQFRLFLDPQGMMRYGTRLENALIPYGVKNPILIPSDSHYASLIARETHLRLRHAGVREVMASVRSIYYIPQARRLVTKMKKRCVDCNEVDGDFYEAADPPPIPDFRVCRSEAFDKIGLDHCGPLYVKEGRGKPRKCYVLILTCAVTRAAHLELVEDMSVKHFMLGFRRFVSARGLPSYILSDNSKTFECASEELMTIINDPKFQAYLSNLNIRWDRYLEYAPWWGGWIEKLNKVFKSSIRKVLGGTVLTFMELYTLLKEVEAVMNSRPLTYVYDDANEGQAITPSLLLYGKDLTQLPPNMFDYKFERKSPQTCRERLKYLEKLKNYFWTRYQREYLTELTERHARKRKGKAVRQAKVDDIVLVKEGGETVKIPRSRWKIGRIVQVHPGRDGQVRSVDVRVATPGGEQPCVLRHKSPRHLVPLECDEEQGA